MDRNLSPVVSALNEAALSDDAWDSALQLVATQFDARAADWEQIDLRPGGRARTHGYSGFRDKMAEEYLAYYHTVNPRVMAARIRPVGHVLTDEEMIPSGTGAHSEFVDWLQKSTDCRYCMGAMLRNNSDVVTVMGIHREGPRWAFTPEERASLQQLVPYLQIVERTSDELRRLRGTRAVTRSFLDRMRSGIAFLDRFGHLSWMNMAMEQFLDRREFVVLSTRGRLLSCEKGGQKQLDLAIRGALKGFVQALVMRSDMGKPRVLRIVPLSPDHPLRDGPGDIALLVLQDLHVDRDGGDLLKYAFGLSPQEANLTLALVSGQSLNHVAEGLGISVATARVHLRHIFEKTDTHRQSELNTVVTRIVGNA